MKTLVFLGLLASSAFGGVITPGGGGGLQAGATAATITNNVNMATWGDSLTAGTGGQTPFPTQLATSTRYTIFNGGAGGETSTQIATRQLADTAKYGWPTIIWAGRNNFASSSTVQADIASMVAALGTNTNYIVLSILNSDAAAEYSGGGSYTQIIALNTALATTYGAHFIDIRAILVAAYNPGNGQDVIDHGRDIPPSTLRFDTLHLNTAGYAVVASTIVANIGLLRQQQHALTEASLVNVFSGGIFKDIVTSVLSVGVGGITCTNSSPYCLQAGNGQGGISVGDDSVFGKITLSRFSQSGGILSLNGTTGSSIVMTGNLSLTGTTALTGGLGVSGITTIGNELLIQGTTTDEYLWANKATSSGNETLNLFSAGTSPIRFNGNTGGISHAGTGGVEIYGGNNGSTKLWWMNSTGHEMTGGTAPGTPTSCGTGPAYVANRPNTDTSSAVTTGTTNTGCTIPFSSTYTKIPNCWCMDETSPSRLTSCTPSATGITLGLSANSSDVVSYGCIGPTNGT